MTDGMERTSMDAIASAAGVSKQTVYSHFHSKDDLFRACVASKVEIYGLDESNLAVGDDLDTVLQHIGRKYLTLLSDMGVIRMFRLMMSEADTHADMVSSFYETGPVTTSRNIANIMKGFLANTDDELALEATRDFLSLIRADYFLELLLGTRSEIAQDERDRHIDLCISQIRKLYEFK